MHKKNLFFGVGGTIVSLPEAIFFFCKLKKEFPKKIKKFSPLLGVVYKIIFVFFFWSLQILPLLSPLRKTTHTHIHLFFYPLLFFFVSLKKSFNSDNMFPTRRRWIPPPVCSNQSKNQFFYFKIKITTSKNKNSKL